MALPSMTLKDRLNRLMNIVVGAVYIVFVLFDLTMNVTTAAYLFTILMDASAIAVAVLFARNAWKWKPIETRSKINMEVRK